MNRLSIFYTTIALIPLSLSFAKETKLANRPFYHSNAKKFPWKQCNPPSPGSRVSLGYRAPEGFGYDHGYTTLSTFISPSGTRTFLPYLDLRGHVFNDGRLAANAGLGGRYAFNQVILGLMAYYDYRDSKQLSSQNQMSGGFELLSKWADLRINGYAPIGRTTGKECPCFDSFTCHTAIARQVVTASLAHTDAEIGFYLPGPAKYVDLYFAAGPYYIFEKHVAGASLGGEWGGRARISLKAYDGITIGGDVTYDPIFNTKIQGWITLSYPLGPATLRRFGARLEKQYPAPCDEIARQFARMTQPVYRNEIIPLENKTNLFDLNCNSKIYFVNNSNCLPGSGTFEQPFNHLSFAEGTAHEGDIIYVFPGDKTPRGMDCGFIMKDRQRLISSAACFELCNICIPPCTPNCSPILSNSKRLSEISGEQASTIINTASCNEIAGFTLDGSSLINNQNDTNVIGILVNRGKNICIRDNCFNQLQLGITSTITSNISSAKQGAVTILNNHFHNFELPTNLTSLVGVFFSGLNQADLSICNNCFDSFFSNNSLFGIKVESADNSNLNLTNNCFSNFSSSESLTGVDITSKNSKIVICQNELVDFSIEAQGADIMPSIAGITHEGLNTTLLLQNNILKNFSISSTATNNSLPTIQSILMSETFSTVCLKNNLVINTTISSTAANQSDSQYHGISLEGSGSSFVACNNAIHNLNITSSSDIDSHNVIGMLFGVENSTFALTNNSITNFEIFSSGTTSATINLYAIDGQGSNERVSLCNNTISNISSFASSVEMRGIRFTGATSTLFLRNQTIDAFSASSMPDLAAMELTVGNSTLCIENNAFFDPFFFINNNGTSCLRLIGNTNPDIYTITNTGDILNIESNDVDLDAGLKTLNNNTGSFTVTGGTRADIDTCNCHSN